VFVQQVSLFLKTNVHDGAQTDSLPVHSENCQLPGDLCRRRPVSATAYGCEGGRQRTQYDRIAIGETAPENDESAI
jgi:hypothetical protein